MKIDYKNEIRQILFPDDIKCIVCGREIHSSRYGLCEKCNLELNENYCLRCGRHKVGINDYCHECSEMPLAFDEARSAVKYDGYVKDIVRRLKYGSAAYLACAMSEYMLDVLLLSDWDFDCFTFVPMFGSRKRKRGYNQAELLAKYLSGKTDVQCLDLLDKVKSTPNQARLNRAERMKNLEGSFATRYSVPEHIVLIDDVMTTGSTLNECAIVLKRAGAKVVYGLTFASVPERPMLDTKIINITDFRGKMT